MIFSNISKDLNLERTDYLCLFFLLVYSAIITVLLINFNESIGIYCSDVYIYLYNSLVFARMGYNNTYLYLSPLICLVTSFLFRLGFVNEVSIYAVTGVFSIFGSLGIYVLLKRYFNSLLSLAGGVLFTSFSLNLLWWANGTLDLPAVGLSVWAILFLILAVDESPKYYILSFVFLVLSIFTRYTCLFLIPLFLLYYLSKHDLFGFLDSLISDRKEAFSSLRSFLKTEEFRYLMIALVLALIVAMLFISVILYYGAELSFLEQGSTFASGSKGALDDYAYTTDTLFYFHDFLNFLFSQKVIFQENFIPTLTCASYLAYLILFILIIGISLGIYRFFNKNKSEDKKQFDNVNSSISNLKEFSYKTSHFKTLLYIGLLLSLAIAILGFKINSIITIAFLLIGLVIIFSLLKCKGLDREDYSVPIFMIGWFLVYFIFFTFLNIKVNRYIITVFPAFIYFVILALNEILGLLDGWSLKIGDFNLSNIIPIVLIVLCMFSAFSFTSTFEDNLDFNDYKIVADYLIDYDEDYASKDIAVFKQRTFNWWLKDSTIAVTTDQLDFLESSNITYYICDEDLKLENYTKIYNYKDIFLYERVNN